MNQSVANQKQTAFPEAAWHTQSVEMTMDLLGTSSLGLADTEVLNRQKTYGPNRLTPPKRRGALIRFLLQFHNMLIYVLLVSATITGIMGHLVDTGVILGVVVINAIIGYLQEGKAESALNAIRNMLSEHATVIRNGEREIILSESLVPGDVVVIASGDKVPADVRIIESRNLRVDESALTGESVPVEKSTAPVATEASLGDRTCLAFSGSLVSYGFATCVVVATGDRSEIGRIGNMLANVEQLSTPLLNQVADFGRKLTYAILAFSVFTFVIGSVWRGYAMKDMFMMAVALAVAAIPEGLPALMTITLALGVQRMARQNAIVRRLPSVETLGSVTVICSDKTGTLTKNEMTVQMAVTADKVFSVSGVGYAPEGGFRLNEENVSHHNHPELMEISRAALLCNDARLHQKDERWVLDGDPTEGALLSMALKAGIDPIAEHGALPRSDVIPFESEYRFMATLHHDHHGAGIIYVKGAPERLLDMCSMQNSTNGEQPLDRPYWEQRIQEAAGAGQRTLAIAAGKIDSSRHQLQFSDVEQNLTLLALFGIIDPPREEAIAAVQKCHAAGINVKMITGDHAETARVIGERLGIGNGKPALIGSQLEQMDDRELSEVVRNVDVFARASPEHKLRLVQALQANGDITAMTGDGVNDAPALKRADVGLAMGLKGTEAAKEASEIVLADDNFATIASAVEEGRTIYDNLKKSILFILPTNGGESLIVIAAIIFDLILPITSVQILWINMATSVTLGIALGFETSEGDVMQRPPRASDDPLLSAFLGWRILFVSILMMLGALGLFLWELDRGSSVESARTIAVSVVIVAEIFYLFSCRHLYRSSLSIEGIFGNRFVLGAIGTLIVMQLLFTYAPFMQNLFGSTALNAGQWLEVVGVGALIFLATEAEKAMQRWRLGRKPQLRQTP
jgi:magnesium-transporting ATPase (P-type)